MPVNNEKIILSRETYEAYKKEYEDLINIERPAVQQALKEARAQGDLSENAEYDAARDRQSMVEGRIAELEIILNSAEILDTSNKKNTIGVGIGSKVVYEDLSDHKIYEISIAGSHDADPFKGKISNDSPLAKALFDAKVGDEIEVEALNKYNIKVKSIK